MAVLTRRLLLTLVVMITAACRSGPEQWGPFRGQVIDAETGRPIAGAHVMVLWIREPPSLHFSQWFYDAQETVTGDTGTFEIPRETRFLTVFVREPGLGIFAPGYLIQAPEVTPAGGRAYVDPTVVKMRPLTTRDERCKYEPFGITADAHRHVPRFVRAQREYKVALRCGQLR